MTPEEELNRLREENECLKTELETARAWALFPLRSKDALYRIDRAGNVTMANPVGEKVREQYGDRLRHSLNRYIQVMLHWFETHREPISKVIKLGEGYYRLQVFAQPKEQSFDVALRDITDRIKAQRDLKLALNRMQTLMVNFQEGLLMEDGDRKMVLTNTPFCSLFGIPMEPNAMIGMDCALAAQHSAVLFADPVGFVTRIGTILRQRSAVTHEILEMADGRILERDYIPIWDKDHYLGHLWKYRDITDRETDRRALAQSEEKFRTLIENMNLGLMEVDNDDRVQYVNHSFQVMTGYSAEELVGRQARTLLLDEEEQMMIEHKAAERKEGKMDVYEVPCTRKDGSQGWFLISGAPITNSKGSVVGSIGIHLDITQRKQLEQDLQQAKLVAEESSKAKEQFLATMSHEIRTPMNAIIGMQRLLARTQLEDRQRRYVDAIGISAGNLLALVNDVLDFSKIQSGKVELVRAPFELREIVRSIRNVLEFKADEKQISLLIDLDPNLPRYVHGDHQRIYQVLMNLVGNAVKFTEEGYVQLRVSKGDQPDAVRFEVEDTGPGMEEKASQRIFDAFSQADASISKKYGGTGLGLSISRQLVGLMEGNLIVFTEWGEGSTFSFTLPLPGCQPELPKAAKENQPEVRLDGKLILVVEDNDFNRLLAQTVLEGVGASVATAVHGLNSLEKVESQVPDVILMDLQMPLMDGLEATRQLRMRGYNGPILALTANAFSEVRDKCLEAGMNDMVVKPFDEQQLISKIAIWTEKMGPKRNSTLKVHLNLAKLKELSHQQMDFVRQMVGLARTQIRDTTQELKESLEQDDLFRVWNLAHRLKATIDHLDIQPSKQTIRYLEDMRKPGSTIEEARKVYAVFAREVEVLLPLLEKVEANVDDY